MCAHFAGCSLSLPSMLPGCGPVVHLDPAPIHLDTPFCTAPLISLLGSSQQADRGCAIVPVTQPSTRKTEARKIRRKRRGKGQAQRVEKRRDPTDGKLRTWEQFMMLHAQGACFNEADRLWEQAGPAGGEPEKGTSGRGAHEEEDDGPPPLLEFDPVELELDAVNPVEDPESPIALEPIALEPIVLKRPKRVRFALDDSCFGLSLRSFADSEGSLGHSEDSPSSRTLLSPSLLPSVLKPRSRLPPVF